MEIDKYLLELIGDIQDYGCDITEGTKKVSNKTLTAHLLAHGVTVTPAVPGPVAMDFDIAEMTFRNGEARMKEKVVALLLEMRTHVCGVQFAQLCNVIEAVQAL